MNTIPSIQGLEAPRDLKGFIFCAFAALLLIPTFALAAFPQTGRLTGVVLDETNVPIPGALCQLSGRALSPGGEEQKADERGRFEFSGLEAGTYRLTCAAEGYRPISKPDLTLAEHGGTEEVEIVLPSETTLKQRVEVKASAGGIASKSASRPWSLKSSELMTLPIAQLNFRAALPLTPGVVRTPDGKLNIKGVPETQGLLLVDSADLVDPVTGSFSVEVPIDAIQELQVYKRPYLAELGRFSGGLTEIHTKPPSDQWNWALNDFLPDPFIEQGHFWGIEDDDPRAYLTGHIVPGKLNFSEAFIYNYDRQFIEGLPFPNNLKKNEGFSSFTQFQYIFTPRHLLSLNVRIFPTRHQFANMDSLVPEPASANYGQRGYSLGGTDRWILASGASLTSLFEATQFDTNAYGQGPEDMLITPNGDGGNYFNIYRRYADQQEWEETYRFKPQAWHGRHQVTAGGDLFHRDYTGTSASHPVLIATTTKVPLERIDFSGLASLGDADSETEGFIQDHGLVNNHFSTDIGLRFSHETLGAAAELAPRLGFVFSPGSNAKTVIQAGAGVFYDRIPMLAADFMQNPQRIISLFSPATGTFGQPLPVSNVTQIVQGRKITTPFVHAVGVTPYNETWSLELDQEVRPNWVLRLEYLGSQGFSQFVINPQTLNDGKRALVLSNRGGSNYQELSSTMRIRVKRAVDARFSYVHSVSRGDLNSWGSIYVPFEQPVIRPDHFADLPSNIPDRLISWGDIHIPWGITASPVLDIHSGFPYSPINQLQNYAGAPDSLHFPAFISLDLKLSKDFHVPLLPFAYFKRHIFRGAFAVFDATNHQNPLDVYNNINSPYFGHFTGFQHITFTTYFDMID
ncbi:MAG: carboxypeptidase regulatory-like domain-containing protein [Terriglobia bacterium]